MSDELPEVMRSPLTESDVKMLLWAIFGETPKEADTRHRFDAIKVGDRIRTIHGPVFMRVTSIGENRVFAGRSSFKAWEIKEVIPS